MRFVLYDPQDREVPSFAIVEEDYVADAEAGEVVVEENPSGKVWDANVGDLRDPVEAERLEEAKQAKIDEFQQRAREDLVPPFMPRHGVDEALLALSKTIKGMLEANSQPVPEHIAAMVSVGEKAMSKKAAIEAATSLSELEGISWTP